MNPAHDHDPWPPYEHLPFEEVVARERREERRGWREINPADWEGEPVPERQWIVQDMIPAGTVTLLSGEGSAGKSTLALQLAVARALGKAWLTTMPRAGRTLVLSAEDDAEELHRRIDIIRAHYGARFSDLQDIRLVDLVGADAVLGSANRTGTIKATGVLDMMLAAMGDFEPDLVIVDALADAFAGDENNRAQARQFIGLLKGPARRLGCAFLCLAHPSLNGLSTGTGNSGSTAWGNSVRSRLFFEKAAGDKDAPGDPDLRTLTCNKANYGPAGGVLTVKWTKGVYLPQGGGNSLDRRAIENRADEKFLELLGIFNTQGQNVGANTGTTYAPAKFAAHPHAGGIGRRQFEAAMQRHLAAKRISIETFGPPSRPRSRLVASAPE